MAQPSWIGYKLNNRYLIEEELGAGGMSAVYKASDPNLKRVVAIKLIHPHLSNNPDFVRRFEAEASSVAQLRHPNIVQVFDFNNDNDTYFMVLEFVPGETLQQRLKRLNTADRKLSTDEVIDIAAKTCDAVDYAHKRGLVHRDIKPANVMLNVQGDPILMDFGIVRILGGTSHTATGAVVGTALYMSPEQIKGEHADHRADIYSLGVMLYEMVNGKPPYDADSAMTIMMMHLNDPIPDLSAASNTIPGIKTIIERALAKDPNKRYQSAGEMAAALRALRTSATGTAAAGGTVVESAPAPAATYVESPAARPASPAPERTYIESSASQQRPPAPAAKSPAPARPAAGSASTPPPAKKTPNRLLLFGGGAAVVIILACAAIAVFALPRLLGTDATDTVEATEAPGGAVAVAVTDTPAPEPTATATEAPPTPTATATHTPTITPTPTATQPEGPYILITDIQVVNGSYAVYYETYNFEPYVSSAQDSNHIHFFWNIYDPRSVGVNGIGDSTGGGFWILYDVPSPFTGYSVSARPQNATQICALVANYDHSVNLDTGNCYDLPE